MKELIKLGQDVKYVGRVDDAIRFFQRATSLQPEYVDVHYQLGLLFAQRNRFETALEHFEVAAGRRPDNVAFQANLALALQNLGLIDRARASWQVVCEIDTNGAYAAQAQAALAKHDDAG